MQSTKLDLVTVLANGSIVIVQPGFNAINGEDDPRAILEPAELDNFDEAFKKVLVAKKPFVLVLGGGFESIDVACLGLASIEQLRLFKDNGLTSIVMAKRHGILVQNARALEIEVVIGGGQ